MNENSPTGENASLGGSVPLRPCQPSSACPCGSGHTFGECCGPVHADPAFARTAEQLMRSRFSAFVTGDAGHLFRTWDPQTRPSLAAIHADMRHEDSVAWKRLLIRDVLQGGEQDATGVVEFIAVGRDRARRVELAERSRFTRETGPRSAWVYVDGDLLTA